MPSIMLIDHGTSEADTDTVFPLEVNSFDVLRGSLGKLITEEPRIIDLVSPSGMRLQLGIGGRYACGQLLRPDRLPPYLCATSKQRLGNHHVEFMLGGTPTEVPPERCISTEDAYRIAEYFFIHDGPDPSTNWIEV